MAFCATCGSPVEGKFCAKCGSAVAAGAAASGPPPQAAPGYQQPYQQPGYQQQGFQQPGYQQPGYQAGPAPAAVPGAMADNVASALCYVLGLLTGIIFLVIAPYNQNRTVRFHAFQSIFLNVAWIAFWIVINVVFSMLHFFTLLFLSPLIGLAFFVLWIYMLISAYQGKKVMLPVIGALAEQQA
jgi:uncharacterized membrane protein